MGVPRRIGHSKGTLSVLPEVATLLLSELFAWCLPGSLCTPLAGAGAGGLCDVLYLYGRLRCYRKSLENWRKTKKKNAQLMLVGFMEPPLSLPLLPSTESTWL